MRNLIRHIIYLFFVAALLVGCKKTEFPDNQNTETQIFKVSGTIDGNDLSLSAGENGYYLFTEYEENYTGNYLLKADLKNASCVNCEESLSLIMKTNTGELHESEFDKDMISPSLLPFYKNHDILVERVLIIDQISNNTNFSPLVLNGFISGPESQALSTVEPFDMDYMYNIGDIGINSNHWFSISNSCENGDVFHGDIFGFSIDATKENIIIDPPVFSVSGVYEWLLAWEDDGVFNSITLLFEGSDPFSFPLEYENSDTEFSVTLAFQANNGDLIIQNQGNIVPLDVTDVPLVQFELINVEHFETPVIKIEYTSSVGDIYQSSNLCHQDFHQNLNGYFEILNAHDYSENENGIPTRLMSFESNCELVNINDPGDIIIIENLVGTIALPIPE